MHKYGLIGCGRISYKHVQAHVDNYPNSILVACVDPVIENAKEKAQQYVDLMKEKHQEDVEVNVYSSYDEMFLAEKIHSVSIATESGYHYKHVLDSLANDCHVIVEKPMALSIAHCDEMIEEAKKRNLKLAICHQNRFNPPIKKLKDAIDEGRFGKIFAGNARILWNRDINYYKQAPWRGTYAMDGGCLMNQCIHNIDLLQWMIGGNITKINSLIENYNHSYIQAEDYGSIQIKFDNKAIGNIEGTVAVYPTNLEETLTILGEKGTVVIGGLAVNEIKTWDFEDKKDSLDIVKKQTLSDIDNVYGNGHSELFKDFIESVSNNNPPAIPGEEGKKAVEIILTAYNQNGRK